MKNTHQRKILMAYVEQILKICYFTATDEKLKSVKVEYLTLKGWKQNTANVRSFQDLPVEAQNYVKKVEELMNVPGKLAEVIIKFDLKHWWFFGQGL